MVVARGWGRRNRKLLSGYRVLVPKMEKFRTWMVVMVSQQCEWPSCHATGPYNWGMVKIVKFYVLYSHSETKTKKNPHIRIFNRYHKVVKGFTDGFMLCLVTQSCMTLCDPVNCSPPVSSLHGNSPGKNTGVGCHALLEEIFPTQGSNPGLLHCSWILYCVSHLGSLTLCLLKYK